MTAADLPAEVHTLEWLLPWEPTDARLEAELAREVASGHPLYRKSAVAVSRRVDQDDVLFWVPDGPAPWAVVHLTWTGRPERRPEWPWAILFASLADWTERCMRPDHAEYERSGADGSGST